MVRSLMAFDAVVLDILINATVRMMEIPREIIQIFHRTSIHTPAMLFPFSNQSNKSEP
jgi:hypothetical protein